MASDEIIWSVISQQFCSFKVKLAGNSSRQQKSTKSTFCRNPHNVTGLCNRSSCPLANSRYATVRSDPDSGRVYLYIKAPERAHLPRRWWEKIRLSNNFARALEQIDERLAFFPKFLVFKCKQRVARLAQVRVREARVKREEERLGEKLVPRLAPKVRRREEGRERKAEAAAKIDRAIERELVERLRSGAYGDRPLNVEEAVWRKVMRGLEGEEEDDGDEEEMEDEEDEEEDEREREYERERNGAVDDVEYVSDLDGESDEDDMEDFEDWLGDGDAGENGEGEDEDGDDVDDDDDDDENDEQDDDDDDEDQQTTPGKGKPANLKRKRPPQPPLSKRKKTSKGPRTAIEYEYVPEVTHQREMATAR